MCVSVCMSVCVCAGGFALPGEAEMVLSQKHRKLQGGFGGGVLLQIGTDRENKCV